MKLNETALEAAAQKFWEFAGREGSFREDTSYPEVWPESAAAAVTAYLEALDAEGLADLYDYWCERVEALPVPDMVREGDTYAVAMNATNETRWCVDIASCDLGTWKLRRVLRRARQPRQWKIGDLVDTTEELPVDAVIVDSGGHIGRWGGVTFGAPGVLVRYTLEDFTEPRIIWLPENGDAS